MPVVTVLGVPNRLADQPVLNEVLIGIRAAVAGIKALGLTDAATSVFFPADLLQFELGQEIVVKVDGLFRRPGGGKPERARHLRQRVADVVLEVINRVLRPHLPECTLVEVIVQVFDHTEGGKSNGFARWSAEPLAPAP